MTSAKPITFISGHKPVLPDIARKTEGGEQ